MVVDRWPVGSVICPVGGSLAHVEGLTAQAVADRLLTRPRPWREQVRYVAIDTQCDAMLDEHPGQCCHDARASPPMQGTNRTQHRRSAGPSRGGAGEPPSSTWSIGGR